MISARVSAEFVMMVRVQINLRLLCLVKSDPITCISSCYFFLTTQKADKLAQI